MSVGAQISGFDAEAWERAKREAIRAIVRAGRKGEPITYSDLVTHIVSISLDPHSFKLNLLLDQISKEEDAAGRGILTALVVLKNDGIPAVGFWNTAADLGRDVRDKMACWIREFNRALQECENHPMAE